MAVKIQIRRGTAAEWTSANPTLLSGEQGLETDTGKTKIGNGVTAWNSLGYVDAKFLPTSASSGFLPTSASSGYVPNGLVTAKGQVVGASGDGVPVAIPAASGNGQVMVSASAEASGNKFSSEVGTLSFPQGSAGAPSITNISDPDTGVFFPANNNVGIATGGISRITVNQNGNVGIGAPQLAGHRLRVGSETGQGPIAFDSVDAVGALSLRCAHTSLTTPTAVPTNTGVYNINFSAYDGTSYVAIARIRCDVDNVLGAVASPSDVPGRLTLLTSADGGTTLFERLRIDSRGTITGSGSLGPWESFAPTLSGAGWDIGNGTASGAFCQIGKVAFFRISIVFGSTSTFGVDPLAVSLPPTFIFVFTPGLPSSEGVLLGRAVNAVGHVQQVSVRMLDSSASQEHHSVGTIGSDATFVVPKCVSGSSGQVSNIVATAPFTWSESDEIQITGTYEIALVAT
jgi:hypothetical protein